MQINEALTLSSLKDNFHQLYEQVRAETSIVVTCESIDTAGLQFLLAIKKQHPDIKIILESSAAKELAAFIGADKCL